MIETSLSYKETLSPGNILFLWLLEFLLCSIIFPKINCRGHIPDVSVAIGNAVEFFLCFTDFGVQ